MAFVLFSQDVSGLGLLYGRTHHGQAGLASIGVGLALVGSEREPGGSASKGPETPPPTDRTLGVPVEVQLMLRPSGSVGVGLYLFGNLNPEHSFIGVSGSIHVGRW